MSILPGEKEAALMNSIIHKQRQVAIALEQIKDKFYHNVNAFMHLILLQMLGYFFAFNYSMSSGGGEFFNFTFKNMSPNALYVMTIFWMIIQGFTLAHEKSRQYYAVSNNFTAYFSDIALLEIYAVIAGLLTMFSGSLLQVLSSLFFDTVTLHSSYASLGIMNYLSLFLTGTLYFLIFGSAAYLVGILRVRFRAFFVLGTFVAMTLLLLGAILGVRFFGSAFSFSINTLFAFYLYETSFIMWLIKVVVTIAVLYLLSYAGIKNLEVNK